MALVRLAVDFEFSSRTWWDKGGQQLWDAVMEGYGGGAVILEEDIAHSWLAQASALPGWDAGPEYAPHPITCSPIAEDEEGLY